MQQSNTININEKKKELFIFNFYYILVYTIYSAKSNQCFFHIQYVYNLLK